MKKYLRVMDGTKSNAGGFDIKINEVVVSPNWNPIATTPEEMGGFNFSIEDKIIRWIHRGDTLYDVEIPEDAEVIEIGDNGVFRSNKIILKNPRLITEEMVLDFYKKSNLPDKTYYKVLVVLLYRKYVKTAKYLINDRINKYNIDECIKEFENYISDNNKFNYNNLFDEAKEIYNILLDIKNNK